MTDLPATLHDTVRGQAAVLGDRTAVLAQGRRWPWQALPGLVDTAVQALRAQGMGAGDRLVLVCETSADALVLMLAAQTLRAWPAFANARLPMAELRAVADVVQARACVFGVDASDAAQDHAVAAGAADWPVAGLGALAWLAWQPDARPEPAAASAGDEVALLLFTSGTTGQPKAVMMSHAGLLHLGRVVARARGTRPDDTVEVAAPLPHVMGVTSALVGLVGGAALRVMPRLSPDELATAIARGELAQVSMVPMAWARLLSRIEQGSLDVSQHRLRTLVSGGAPLDPALKARIEAVFQRPVTNAYGMTECAPLARAVPRPDMLPWSVGRPEDGVEVRIVEPGSERPAAPDEVGAVQARGGGVMKGYYGQPEASREVLLDGGWYDTGDLGRWLPDGDFAVVGRRKEMIIRSGFNVYPAEVEGALASHPAVLLAAVVGEPAELGDERVVAYLQPRPGAQPSVAELEAHVRERLAGYKCPSVYVIVPALPMGATGKVLKRLLRRDG